MSKNSNTVPADSEKLVLGGISGVFGVKGWVKVFSETDPRENILSYSPWFVEVNKQWQAFKLVDGKKHGKAIIAQLEGINDRDQAETLKRARIAINASQLPATSENEFYWRDLKTCQVVNQVGYEFGQVVDILETGANDVLVVRSSKVKNESNGKAKEFLIPYLWQRVILKVDLDAGLIEVDWEPDYLDD
ncbi:16S rRNA processing protein RimM [hydrothermal vent metagenome]|uniref:16S rRNA processing protein RimM n=1 Tax=hydrothermal vent metagenome TaxID=652676 RepID=A0A3B1A704_9ZZZZ